ncbi:MAG: trimethylamine methyltransferase family protein [Hoeflea sp.]|uniref:trimethylamine methyltransferase family protein n=1 Tax=Hoeflea sp. TaxID=1940281 RepID=UPI001D8C2290|nr:trimethylamine methyltransferase family protein [Hoeflea sp.]MBU4529104.1 trimethylamine methyltransferase family protein [Alphaproteobacteria bacterium]MBU4543509.1 trimethylamine methyltransferase family protein [Alphaproteobacteria bacterium]MBU4549134.1 trimethylamine methyltransferase family protein [Alphaproteobacteria bacterium]MBV1725269.1 trimethylamine methyltransferase family protein [Hoeflea sp.]MBV1785230.1 trimethylamine methyltransferase family protein [Hoeflea sp.]
MDAADIIDPTAAAPRRRERSGGRDGRRSGQGSVPPHRAAPYIIRNIPSYDILGEENLVKIEAAADRILVEVGIEFRDDPVALALWKAAGARVEDLLVKFEPGMLREILKSAPSSFTQHARNPANSVEIGGKSVVFAPAYGSPFVMDLDKGRRYGTIEDFRNFIKLAQSSPWLHHSGGTICEPVDVPVNKRHLDMVYSHLKYSDRCFMGSVTAENRAEDNIEMSRIVFGRDFVDENCVILGNVNVNSPLVWDGTMTNALRAYARANQAAVIVPFILGGAMGPVTNAGAIAQSLGETMAGCALTQLERKGAPVIFGNFLSSMSLRSGSPTFGTPEPAIGSMVIGQLARRLNLPLRCAGNFSNSKLPDAQAMNEGTMSMLSAVHCGANFILHSAGFLDGLLSMSYEKFMMDADFCGALHSYLAGVVVDDNSLALDAFREVGVGKHFLGCAHTMENYQTAFWDSEIADNEPFEKWDIAGRTDAATRANARWKRTLADYQAPPMDVATDEALVEFVERTKAQMADAWY